MSNNDTSHFRVVRTSVLADRLSQICAWSMVDTWPLCWSTVRYGSANQANSAFHPSWVGKWVVTHVITLTTRVETIKRQTRAAYGCMVAGQSPSARARTASHRLYARSVCDTKVLLSCGMQHYITVTCLSLCLPESQKRWVFRRLQKVHRCSFSHLPPEKKATSLANMVLLHSDLAENSWQLYTGPSCRFLRVWRFYRQTSLCYLNCHFHAANKTLLNINVHFKP